jgi:hypothetical protein
MNRDTSQRDQGEVTDGIDGPNRALQRIALSAIVKNKEAFAVGIYKTKTFKKWAQKEGLSDKAIGAAVAEMESGLCDADLGGGLFKKRIASAGKGKSGGFRTLVATNKGDRWIFVYGFAKNEKSNIDRDELDGLKLLSKFLLSMTPQALAKAKAAMELVEVERDE